MSLTTRAWISAPALAAVGVSALLLCGSRSGSADEVIGTDVQWLVALPDEQSLASGQRFALKIHADIRQGWHIYALHEPVGGPTALSVSVAENSVAVATGVATGPAPFKKFDRSFNLETQTYSGATDLQLPLKLNADLAVGPHTLPVAIRFQSCSDRECRPPRTVRVQLDISVLPGNDSSGDGTKKGAS